MDWENMRESSNVEDRRGMGGGFGIPGGGVAVGGGAAIIIAILSLIFGINPASILGGGGGSDTGSLPQTQQSQSSGGSAAGEDTGRRFASKILGSTEDAWTSIFQKAGQSYTPPRLVLYSGSTPTACGQGDAAVGPFYCPRDSRVYLDLDFFNELQNRLGAGGDFADAYVIAHEVGHHVQNLLGISDKVEQAQARASQTGANQLSVRLELQADCFAGIWGNYARSVQADNITQADIQQAVNAAQAIGDDALQRAGRGYVVPDSFTHGSSAQRVRWFTRGLQSGDVNSCDTFKPSYGSL